VIHLLALAGVLAISFSAIFVRLAGVSPDTAAFFRCAYAVPPLLVVWLALRRRDDRTARERLIAYGAGVFLAVDFAFWHRAIGDIGAGLGTVLGNVQVVFVGFAAWALYRERPTRLAFLLVPVVFAGVVLMSGLGGGDAFGKNPGAGVVFGVLTSLAYTGFLLMLRASNRRLVPPAGPLLDATVGAAAGSLLLGLVFDSEFSLAPGWPAHGWLIALALSAQVVGWLLISWALPRLPALETSVLLLVQPMSTVMWAYLIFGERLSPVQWAGVVLVLGGVATLAAKGSVRGAERGRARRPKDVTDEVHPIPAG
jgi:drug/metabolite transporter (DMT)-like permease